MFVAAGFNPGSHSARLLAAVRDGRLRMVWDDATHAEIEHVIGRILACPLLIVTGGLDANWPRDTYAGLQMQAEYAQAEACSHWGLVLNRRALSHLV